MKYRAKKALLVSTLVVAMAAGTFFSNLRSMQNSAPLAALGATPAKAQSSGAVAAGRPPVAGRASSAGPAQAAAQAPVAGRAPAAAPSSNVQSSQTNPSSAATVAAANTTPTSGALANGSYTGQTEYAYYGNVQVQAVVQNGKIQAVNVLQHPSENGTSRYINSVAMPYLVQEAVQAQSTNISLITGATLSSEAFVQSLSTALTQAGA